MIGARGDWSVRTTVRDRNGSMAVDLPVTTAEMTFCADHAFESDE